MTDRAVLITDSAGRICTCQFMSVYSSGNQNVLGLSHPNTQNKNLFTNIMTPYSRAQLILTLGNELMSNRNCSNIIFSIYKTSNPKNYDTFEDFACSCFQLIKANISKIYLKFRNQVQLQAQTQINIVAEEPVEEYVHAFLLDMEVYRVKAKYQRFMEMDPFVVQMREGYDFRRDYQMNFLEEHHKFE